MKAINFPNSNTTLPTKAGNIPVFIGSSGEAITRWSLTWKEIWQVIRNRAIFVTQYPQSVAFPQTKVAFRELTESEKAEIKAKHETEELEAKRKHVIENRNKRNPARIRRLHEVAKEQGMVRNINGAKTE